MKIRRYMLFTGCDYYPEGGISDFVASYNTLVEAKEDVENNQIKPDWAHIFDIVQGMIVSYGRDKSIFDVSEFSWTDCE